MNPLLHKAKHYLKNHPIFAQIKFNKDKIFVAYTANQLDGKGYDIWSKVFDASQLDFSLFPVIVPDKFDILYGNYPNPVNGITKIAFKLAFPHNVKITLYDILGNKLGNVINEFRNEGYQEVDVDVGRLASGVYIYKIESNNTLISKFVVIK